jgi:phospholipid-binding lipoprotein MlaA
MRDFSDRLPRRQTATRRVLPAVGLALALLPAQQVAAAPVANDATGSAHSDPFEGVNRRMYSISMGLDRAIIAPVTHLYLRAPAALRNRISAFIYNLGEPRTVLNDVLQFRPRPAGQAVARLVINTTVGLGGLFDVAASHAGLAGDASDFGQTLGRWGIRTGPYLFVPFLGPTNVRDGFGGVIDALADPVAWATGGLGTTFAGARGGVTSLDTRAQADSQLSALDDAIDPYATVRSAFLQSRAALVDLARGRAPTLPDFDDPAPQEAAADAAPAASPATAPEAAPAASSATAPEAAPAASPATAPEVAPAASPAAPSSDTAQPK